MKKVILIAVIILSMSINATAQMWGNEAPERPPVKTLVIGQMLQVNSIIVETAIFTVVQLEPYPSMIWGVNFSNGGRLNEMIPLNPGTPYEVNVHLEYYTNGQSTFYDSQEIIIIIRNHEKVNSRF